jgi:hypothetical protein
MAALALNTYKTVRSLVTTGITTAYVVPNGVSSIHLYSVVSNVSTGIATVTVSHNRAGISYELIKDARIPATDALNPVTGSLVLEVGDRIEVTGLSNNTMKFVMSILESAK